MKKKWLLSAGLSAALLIPLAGFSSNAEGQAKIMPNQVTFVNGGFFPGGVPKDGIISGGLGCVMDIHEFDKGLPVMDEEGNPTGLVGDTIVFLKGIKSNTAFSPDQVSVYVEVSSNGQKVLELPMIQEGADYKDGNPLWVGAIRLFETDLPTGTYNYQFKVKENGKNGKVLDVWVPKNHKFTVTDSRN
ncbi:hypothetical protein [Neobacillus sp. SAB-20_R2A]|uniref:hypothetical protein n=1 Tax=Neobacillus sp. SAB-20_R2A TaxID=3120519 RepID=UPI003C6E3945